MKYLCSEKIDIVNQIAEAICKHTCTSETCNALCQLAQLKTGLKLAFQDKLPMKEIIVKMKDNHQHILSMANRKYDGKYELLENLGKK